ncbi:MAG: septal ring lytic transglycosylase RlpA family protein [Candidatus Omnitrophica bacterium]|nr:septal ring lytic transglycosylase RlpA family protein [Candidatus Omnitrophota bacterium]
MKTFIIFLMIGIVFNLTVVDKAGSSYLIYKGMASWYSEEDPGILETTANMEIFDDTELACAIWGLPFNTLLKVTNLKNNQYVTVRVNDRGPARRLVRQGRVIDLTKTAFQEIADLEQGLASVSVEIL